MSQQQPMINIPIPDFVNDPNMPLEQKRVMLNGYNNQRPQVVDVSQQAQRPVLGIADAQKSGTNWTGLLQNLGGYLSAAGSAYGAGANPSQGLLNATNATQKRTQDINQYNTMAPQYQSMGYDVSGLDPSRGGAGLPTTPDKMIELQSKIAQLKYLNYYRNAMLNAKNTNAATGGAGGGKGVTIGTLRMMSPQFKKMMDAQYGFNNGQNANLLNQVVPTSLVQGYMPATTKVNNMVYSGGLNSSQRKTGRADIYQHGGSGDGKGKSKPNDHTW